jgi:hypothetical protein
MWSYQVVELSGVPEPDEATLNPVQAPSMQLITSTGFCVGTPLLALRGTLQDDSTLWELLNQST